MMSYYLTTSPKKKTLLVILAWSFIIVLALVSIFLVKLSAPIDVFLLSYSFLVLFYVLLFLYLSLFYSGNIVDPIILFSLFFIWSKYFTHIYNSFFFTHPNYVYDYSIDKLSPLLSVYMVSYAVTLFSVILLCLIRRPRLMDINGMRREVTIKNISHYIFICYAVLAISKAAFIYLGLFGSVTTFVSGPELGIWRIIIPLFYFYPLFIAYFSIRYYSGEGGGLFLALTVLTEMCFAIVTGDIRNILYVLLPYLCVASYFTVLKITITRFILISSTIFVFVAIAMAYELAIYSAMHAGYLVNYWSLIFNLFELFNVDLLARFFEKLITVFAHGHLDYAALYLYERGISLEASPFVEYLKAVIPFSKTFGLEVVSASDLQRPLFEASLYSTSSEPYMVLPNTALAMLSSGWAGLVSYSFLNALILYFAMAIPKNRRVWLIWYAAFFPQISIGMLTAVNQVGSLLVLCLFGFLIVRLIFKLMGAAFSGFRSS